MSFETKVYVTASNPAPGQQRPVEGDPTHTLPDGGLGVNTYIAGGQVEITGTVPVIITYSGSEPRTSPNSFLHTVQPTRLVGGNHEGTVMDSVRWTSGTVDGGSVLYHGHGYAEIVPGTASIGEAWLMTATKARYLTPFPNFVMTAIRLSDEGVVGNRRRWGATDNGVDNFVGFELSGTERHFIAKCSGAFDVAFPASGTWTTPVSDETRRYEIWWWREQAIWYVDGVQVFSLRPDGLGSDVHALMTSMTLQVRARSTNSGVIPSGSGTIEMHEGSITRMGPRDAQAYYYRNPAGTAKSYLLKKGPGTFFRVTINGLSTANSDAKITFYDGLDSSGTIVAQIDTKQVTFPITMEYGLEVSSGLYVVVGSTAAEFTAVFD